MSQFDLKSRVNLETNPRLMILGQSDLGFSFSATVTMGATLVEGATLEIGEWCSTCRSAAMEIGATLVEGATLEIGGWCT